MAFRTALANLYRANGYLFISRDTMGYDIYHQTPSGPFHYLQSVTSKSEAVREAKRLSMEMQLGFDPAIDII